MPLRPHSVDFLFNIRLLSAGLPLFCFFYYIILGSKNYPLTQTLCKASSVLTILLGLASPVQYRVIIAGAIYRLAYDWEVLRSQRDFYVYCRNVYNFLVAGAQMLL